MNYFFNLFLLIAFCSCTDEVPQQNKTLTYLGKPSHTYSRILFENGPRQGFQLIDSMGTEYNYRYVTSTIINDSTVPIHLHVSFSEEYKYLKTKAHLEAKVFLLPRELTPNHQQFDTQMSKGLKQFLQNGLNEPVTLNKTILPNERCVMTFGVLNEVNKGEYMRMELIASNQAYALYKQDSINTWSHSKSDSKTIYLAFHLLTSYIIPCGYISID